jgi:glycosyltransferase involved in cell wall biosynthesis
MKPCIYFITDYWYPKIGGLENSINYLLKPLSRYFAIEIHTYSDKYVEERHNGIKVIRFANKKCTYYPAVFEYIKSKNYDAICHFFGFSYQWPKEQSILIQKIKTELNIPIVFKIPTSNDANDYINEFYTDKKECVDYFVTLNDHIKDELAYLQIAADNVFSVSNSVPTGLFKPAGETEKALAKEQLKIPQSKFTLGFLGRFIKRKRIDLLVAAINRVEIEKRPNLLLVGYSDPMFNSEFCINDYLSEHIHHIPTTKNIHLVIMLWMHTLLLLRLKVCRIQYSKPCLLACLC